MNSYFSRGAAVKVFPSNLKPSDLFLFFPLSTVSSWSIDVYCTTQSQAGVVFVIPNFLLPPPPSFSSWEDQVHLGRGGWWPPTSSAVHRAGRTTGCGRAGDGVEGDSQVSCWSECRLNKAREASVKIHTFFFFFFFYIKSNGQHSVRHFLLHSADTVSGT